MCVAKSHLDVCFKISVCCLGKKTKERKLLLLFLVYLFVFSRIFKGQVERFFVSVQSRFAPVCVFEDVIGMKRGEERKKRKREERKRI